MDFINNFVCFDKQELNLVSGDNGVIEIISPFVEIKISFADSFIKGFKSIKNKNFMVFITNSSGNDVTLKHLEPSVEEEEQFNVSTNSDKQLTNNSYEVLVYNDKWWVRDINII